MLADSSQDHLGFNGRDRARWKGALWMGPETEVYFMRNRWMEPRTGRFLSEDLTRLEGGINPIVFGASDPINRFDPRGTCDVYLEYFYTNLLTGVETITDRVCIFTGGGNGGGGPGRGLTACEKSLFAGDFSKGVLESARIFSDRPVPEGFLAITLLTMIHVTPDYYSMGPASRYVLLAEELGHVSQWRQAWYLGPGTSALFFMVRYGSSFGLNYLTNGFDKNKAYYDVYLEQAARNEAARIIGQKDPGALAACAASNH